MFTKILIVNRGEIATRVIRTCRDMGIRTVALYEAADIGSLHVRLADECVELRTALGFLDIPEIIRIAKETGVQAVHPGYGFLAERADFIEACEAAHITFIGPPASVVRAAKHKPDALTRVQAAGYPVVDFARLPDTPTLDEVHAAAEQVGYPLVIKSCRGGRGRGERLVRSPAQLPDAWARAQAETLKIYGNQAMYMERAVLSAHQIGVQILADDHGHITHLGEREGSLIYGNQKIFEETPSPSITPEQRARLWQYAVDIARLFNYRNAGTVEFLLDGTGQFYFTEIKARIQVEHLVTEMVSRVDIVREQISIATGQPTLAQEAVRLRGWAMQCRISAEDPWRRFMPTPGKLRRVRLPSGPHIRVDTYVYCGCDVPPYYDPTIIKLAACGETRAECLSHLQRAASEMLLIGTPTNLPLHQRILHAEAMRTGQYTTEFLSHPFENSVAEPTELRNVAVAAALAYHQRASAFNPSTPEITQSGWHRASRDLPR